MIPVSFAEISPLTPEDRVWFFKLGERPHRQDHRRRAACRVRKRDRAVRCAVEVQRGMAERNAAISPEERIEFRVGINLGDVIVEGEDIFGDGVNIAARLEALAEPGGICVSRVVRDQVRDKLDVAFENLGEQQSRRRLRLARRAHDLQSAGRSRFPP